MKRTLVTFCIVFGLLTSTAQAAKFKDGLELITKTRYFELYGEKKLNLEFLLNQLNFAYFLSLDAYYVEEIKSTEDLLARTIDAIFLEINDSLGLTVDNYFGTIRFMKDHDQLKEVFYSIFRAEFKERAFYFYEGDTIYISLPDMTLGMLGHEMAHAIISHYFVVPPPKKLQEVLSGYVEFKLRKATNDLPESSSSP